MPTTQDLIHGLDITGLGSVTASQIMQILDAASPAFDRGLILETFDSAPDVPSVPNATVTTKWKRYLWKRITSSNDTILYFWKESAVSDIVYLKWIKLNEELINITADVAEALSLANNAIVDSANALSTSQTAQSIAQQALDAASAANTNLATLQTTVNNLQSAVIEAVYQTGDLRYSAAALSYSTSSNEGWLKCDGGAVNRVTFATLFAAIGTSFGAGDGVTTFNIPDFKGRSPMGSGLGLGLTSRSVGDKIGEENHVLTEAELAKHKHREQCADASTDAIGGVSANRRTFGAVGSPVIDSTIDTLEVGGDNGHNNIPPVLVINIYIKT